MTLKSFAVNLPRILVCTVAFLILGACSSGSSSGDGESTPQDTTAPSDSAAGPNTPPAGSPGTPPGDSDAANDTPAPPNDTPNPPGDTTATPPGGTPTGEVSGNTQFLGVITFAQTSGQYASADISADFIKFNRGFPTAGITDELVAAEDSCAVETIDPSGDDDIDIPGFDESAIEFVSAGQVITVRSAAGSYVDLVENTEFGISIYLPAVEELPTPFPADLIVDIPGNVFPAFANVAVPNVEPLVITSDGGADGSYTWVAGNNPSARVSLVISAVDTSNPGTSRTYVSCVVVDDGEFSIPASITSQLPADYSVAYTEYSRTTMNLVQSGDAVLMITSSSGE